MISKALVILMMATMIMSTITTTTFLSRSSSQSEDLRKAIPCAERTKLRTEVTRVHEVVHFHDVLEAVDCYFETATVLGAAATAASAAKYPHGSRLDTLFEREGAVDESKVNPSRIWDRSIGVMHNE